MGSLKAYFSNAFDTNVQSKFLNSERNFASAVCSGNVLRTLTVFYNGKETFKLYNADGKWDIWVNLCKTVSKDLTVGG